MKSLAFIDPESVKSFRNCSYKVCGKPHWSSRGLFVRSVGGVGWSTPKLYCDVICYARDVVYQETGKVCEVLFNG